MTRRVEQTTPPHGTARQRLQRLGLLLAGGGAASLVGFHLVLFVGRLRDLSILEPRVAVQWLAAGLLLAFLGYLKSRRVSLLSGRSALAFWLLVLLLHVVPHAPAPVAAAGDGDLLLLLPNVWMAIAAGLLLVGLRPSDDAVAVCRLGNRLRQRSQRPFDGFAASILARPPPVPLR